MALRTSRWDEWIVSVHAPRGDSVLDTPAALADRLPIREVLGSRSQSLWRYGEVLPFTDPASAQARASMGEGSTPLLPLDANDTNVRVKLDYLSPSGSFKDRGAVVMLAKAAEQGVEHIVVDSSGNAGAAAACYAARLGMRCDVFIPAGNSPAKFAQAVAFGAAVHAIDGDRSAVAGAAADHAAKEGALHASHAHSPWFLQGTKTFAYECWEQLGGVAPDAMIIPAGQGTLLLGCFLGFRELLAAELISRMPQLFAAQPTSMATLAAHVPVRGGDASRIHESGATVAEGIAVGVPHRLADMAAVVNATGAGVVPVTDERIVAAQRVLAGRGFYVEPTGAVAYAALDALRSSNAEFGVGRTIALPLCGSGLKTSLAA